MLSHDDDGQFILPHSIETSSKFITKEEFSIKVKKIADVNSIEKVHYVSALTGKNVNKVFEKLVSIIKSTQGLKGSIVENTTIPPISYS